MVARFTAESPLVTAEWLINHSHAPDVRILDCTWYLPSDGREGRQSYNAHHIPGSRFFDIEEIADTESSLPHMLPRPEKFASRARKLGLGDGHRIICYDQNDYMASARVWWMFRAMGHGDVAVLDGGFNAWKAAGGPQEDLPPLNASDRHFTVRARADLIRSREQMEALVAADSAQIIDARPADRFRGEAAEPRPGVRKGHIPGSLNLPYRQLLTAQGTMLPPEQLEQVFAKAGVDFSRPIVNTCGSGVTAAVLALAEAVLGYDDVGMYDGSWAEWGAETSGLPVAEG